MSCSTSWAAVCNKPLSTYFYKRILSLHSSNLKYVTKDFLFIVSIPIPTIIGQKAWREERVANIYAAIKALVAAINAERDKQNENVRKYGQQDIHLLRLYVYLLLE